MVNRLVGFIETLGRSCTSLDFYSKLNTKPVRASVKFGVVFFVLAALVESGVLLAKYYPMAQRLTAALPSRLLELYPQELELTVTNGKIRINQPEPYYYPLQRVLDFGQDVYNDVLGASSGQLDYLLVIDTGGSIDDFESYRTYALLTESRLVYYNENERIEVVPLNELPDFTLNQTVAEEYLVRIVPYIERLPNVLAILLIVFMVAYYPFFAFVYALLLGVITWPVAKLFGLKLQFSKRFQIVLHLLAAFTVFSLLIRVSGLQISFPFFRTIVMVLLFTTVLTVIPHGRTKGIV